MASPLSSALKVARDGVPDGDPLRQADGLLADVLRELRGSYAALYLMDGDTLGRGRDGRAPKLIAARGPEGAADARTELEGEILTAVLEASVAQIFAGSASDSFPGDRLAGAPLVIGSEVIGAVLVGREDIRSEFDPTDAERLAALAAQIPLALELVRGVGRQDRVVRHELEMQKMEALGRLAGGVAHDLNNLFFIIQSAATTLEFVRELPDKARPNLRLIHDTTERATELVRHLVALARGQRLEPEVCSLPHLCRHVAPQLEQTLGPVNSLRFELSTDTPLVKVDRVQLERVIINLVANARDAMPDGGSLLIATDVREVDAATASLYPHVRSGPHAVLIVADTGTGIEPEVLKRVFEPFFTTKRARAGSGLGLASSWGIVAQSGGFIEVDSVVGRGTTFRVHLPKTDESLAVVG